MIWSSLSIPLRIRASPASATASLIPFTFNSFADSRGPMTLPELKNCIMSFNSFADSRDGHRATDNHTLRRLSIPLRIRGSSPRCGVG